MREIKFRAWSNEYNRYCDFVTLDEGCRWIGWIKSSRVYLTTIDIVVEQCTNLKDKNGKEIYEGDRIKIEGSDTIYMVEYGCGVWVARFGDESGDNICLFHYVQKDTVLYAEVIGNIHESPKDFRPEHFKRMGVIMVKGGEE